MDSSFFFLDVSVDDAIISVLDDRGFIFGF